MKGRVEEGRNEGRKVGKEGGREVEKESLCPNFQRFQLELWSSNVMLFSVF